MSNESLAAARAYYQRSIEGASPARLVRLMLEGAVRRIDRAAACDAKNVRTSFVADLSRADEIVAELRLAIAPEVAPELAAQTDALYDFASTRIAAALAARDTAPLAGARTVLAQLLDAWKKIDEGVA